MQKSISGKLFSASDLVNFATCSHLTHVDLVNLETPLPKAADIDDLVLIQGKGFEHEGRYTDVLQVQSGAVVDLTQEGVSDDVAFANTKQEVQSGAQVLFQATLLGTLWAGHGVFLVRVETLSKLGDFSNEVLDTKLARSSGANYPEMLTDAQGFMPRHMYVMLGDGRKAVFPDAPLPQVILGAFDLSDHSEVTSQLGVILRNGDAAKAPVVTD